MQIDQVINISDWVGIQQRMKVYRIYEDTLGAHHVRYEQYLFTPYDRRGLPIPALEKGITIDKMI